MAGVFAGSLPAAPPGQRPIDDPQIAKRAVAVKEFLYREMDRGIGGTVVYDDDNSGFAGFFPSGRDDPQQLLEFDNACRDETCEGLTCIKLGFTPRDKASYAGLWWTYPDLPGGNWGQKPGRDLRGATKLTGRIRGSGHVELVIGGINHPPHDDPRTERKDPFRATLKLDLTADWADFSIPIPRGASTNGVIGGLGVYFSASSNKQPAVAFLDSLSYDNAEPGPRRLIRSYVPTADAADDAVRSACFLYDNDIALLALLALGDKESLRRARILADAICWAQRHDPHYRGALRDGRWRNAYACGPLGDEATDAARLPGTYKRELARFIEDRYQVSSDTGNVAWTVISLLAAHKVLDNGRQDSPYLTAALEAGQWIKKNCQATDELGGCRGGFEGWPATAENPAGPQRLAWRSSEHQIDIYAAGMQLAAATGDDQWRELAMLSRQFLLQMRESDHFLVGVRDDAGTRNRDAIAADVQTWAVLALSHDPEFRRVMPAGPGGIPACIQWVEKHCREESGGLGGYKFSDRGAGLWPEGAAHLACCYQQLGQTNQAQRILLEAAQTSPPDRTAGGILAAWPEDSRTGFLKEFAPGDVRDWTYPARPHLCASAFWLLSALGVNPYRFSETAL